MQISVYSRYKSPTIVSAGALLKTTAEKYLHETFAAITHNAICGLLVCKCVYSYTRFKTNEKIETRRRLKRFAVILI